ncbi:ATP-binding protein [Gynuella sunshinyii]|uniref:histidine kinase n=1 Tax=Gynuella sunshinyii YC6258 TaxID=1445510 RepID=A0A0C5VVD1_9GAMM|nr:ATP-binding protein [Gynuella sunshinyii]AJQ94399.1 signal transduction histidine kinase [Gynuella sunshinyii YC6258]
MSSAKQLIFFVLVLFNSHYLLSAQLKISHETEAQDVTAIMDYIQDKNGFLSFRQIIGDQYYEFTPTHSDLISSNTQMAAIWLRLSYENDTGINQHRILVTDTHAAARVDQFDRNSGPLPIQSTGASVKYSDRPIVGTIYALPVVFPPGEGELFFRVSNLDPMNLDLSVMGEHEYQQLSRRVDLMTNVLLVILFVFSLVILLLPSTKDRGIQLLVMAYGICLTIFHLGWSGYFAIWINYPLIDPLIKNSFAAIATALYVLLVYRLGLPDWSVRAGKIWSSMAVGAGVIAIYSLYPLSFSFLYVTLVLLGCCLIIANIMLMRIAGGENKAFLVAAAANLILVAIIIASVMGLTGSISTTFWSTKIFSLLNLMALVYGLTQLPASKHHRELHTSPTPFTGTAYWQLLQKINHDLRTPINGVMGMSELLSETSLSANQLDFLSTIQNSGQDLLATANEIKALSRILSNQLILDRQTIDLQDFLHEITVIQARMASIKGVELITDIHPSVPNHLEGDPSLLEQVMRTIIDNAVKHTDKGEVLVQVSRSQQDEIRFRITDTGIGIPRERCERLFEFDSDPENKTINISLPICSRIIKAMGGQLGVSSEKNLGTTFWFTIRMPSVHIADNSMPIQQSLHGLRMLIVDDNMTCRKVIEHQATSWGIRVDAVATAQEALAQLHTQYHLHNGYNFVILDHQMPKMTGTQLAQRIQSDHQIRKDMTIIMMTGMDIREDDPVLKESGIQFLLTKPVTQKQFQQVLFNALSNHSLEQTL